MKLKAAVCLTFALAASTLAGCAARSAVVSNASTAYFARATAFGSTMYYCQAPQGSRPTCREVAEQ